MVLDITIKGVTVIYDDNREDRPISEVIEIIKETIDKTVDAYNKTKE